MNIFFIPSWYPSKKSPTSGYFIQEQAKFIGKCSKNDLIIINLWGDQSTKLNFEKPIETTSNLLNFFSHKPYQKQISPRVWEFNQPALEWSARFLKGNIGSIIESSNKNFLRAQKKFGKINLIHAHVSFPAGFVAMKLSQEYRIPYIITEHMGPFPLAPFRDDRLQNLVTEPLKKASKVIAPSHKLQEEMSKYKIKSLVIPNMVNDKFFYPKLIPKSQKIIFFTLADISPEKGIGDLMVAIPKVVDENKNVQFRIGGRGKYLKKYQKLAKDIKVNENVVWLGYLSRHQVRKEMQKCQAFILASHHESFGLVFVEAMASGKPIISTKCGGPEDIINKNIGYLTEVGNVERLSLAILKMMDKLASFNSKIIRQEFEKKYSPKIVVSKIKEVYNQVLKDTRKIK